MPEELPVTVKSHRSTSGSLLRLEVTHGPNAGERFEFDRHETFVVGRSGEAHLQLKKDGYFSRFHFRLEIAPPKARLIDLDSRNGTKVNGKPVRVKNLSDGDVISGGKTRIRVTIVVPASPPPAADPLADTGEYSNRPDSMDVPLRDMRRQGATETAAWTGRPTLPADSDDSLDLDLFGGEGVGVDLPTPPGYSVEEEIGRGAMGVVYRATHLESGNACALKLVTPEYAANEQSLAYFVREASSLSQLDHPRIVPFRGMGLVDGRMFLAMDYVEHVPLEEVLAGRSDSDRTRIVVGLARQVLDGLAHAHEKSLVHRDVKPENILLARRDGRLHALLTDFGLAKNYQNAGFSGITGENEMRGSLAFMPPEQVRDARFAKPGCDLYGLGVTLYLWLSDEFPYDFSRLPVAIGQILDDEVHPKSLGEYRPDLPAGLIAVVDRSLANDPAKRFASATEMREALTPFARAAR